MNEKEVVEFFDGNYAFPRRLRKSVRFDKISKIFNSFEIEKKSSLEEKVSEMTGIFQLEADKMNFPLVLSQLILSDKYGNEIKEARSIESAKKRDYFGLSSFIRAKASYLFYEVGYFGIGDIFLKSAEEDMLEVEKGKPFIDFDPDDIFYHFHRLVYEIKSFRQDSKTKRELYFKIHEHYKGLAEELKNDSTNMKNYRIALAFSCIGRLLFEDGQEDEFIKYATIALKKFNLFISKMDGIEHEKEMRQTVLFRLEEIEKAMVYLPEITKVYFNAEIGEIKERLFLAKTAANQ